MSDHLISCPDCGGTGMKMPEGCETCDSNGWVDDKKKGGYIVCPECDGKSSEKCERCDGHGDLEKGNE